MKPCGHGLLCTRIACQQPKPLKLSRRDAKTFVEALLAEEIHECPICYWQDGSHNSRCWIGALAIKWREAEANSKRFADELGQQTEHYDFALALLDKIKAALADGGVMPQTLPDGVQLIVRERAEYSRKYHEAMEILSRWENIDHATTSAKLIEAENEIKRLRALLAEGPHMWPPIARVEPVEPDDEPLRVAVVGGRLVISIGVRTLAFAVANSPDHEGDPIKITDPLAAAKEIRVELVREEEDGTTEVHKLLDKAAYDAWENGGEGFAQ